jgi:uncharacterized membrane protein
LKNAKAFDTRKLVLLGLFTAIVFVLQFQGSAVRFGTFSITLVLAPIVIGAALVGSLSGGWLGLVFGASVLASGDAAPFLAVNAPGTIAVVLLKGALAGLASGYVYKMLERKNKLAAAYAAAAICPIINTGVFILGSYVFFLGTVAQWGEAMGFASTTSYIFLGLVGINFPIEFVVNIVLAPVIVRLIQSGSYAVKEA